MDGAALTVAVALGRRHTAPMLDRDLMSSMARERHHPQRSAEVWPINVHFGRTREERNTR